MGESADRGMESILRSLAFVEGRLGENIGVADMAEAACYSLFHFTRLFSTALGHAPYDYLVRRRIARSAPLIVSRQKSIIDIALEHGFELPDTFARAFRRCFGVSPSEARKSGMYPERLARTRPSEEYISFMLERGLMRPRRIVEGDTVYRGCIGARGGDEPPEGFCRIFATDSPEPVDSVFIGGRMDTFASEPARFPELSTCLPHGARACFDIGTDYARAGFVLDYAFRVWIPESLGVWIPPWYRIEGDTSFSLVIPLAAE